MGIVRLRRHLRRLAQQQVEREQASPQTDLA
jgi:hypothetical protein